MDVIYRPNNGPGNSPLSVCCRDLRQIHRAESSLPVGPTHCSLLPNGFAILHHHVRFPSLLLLLACHHLIASIASIVGCPSLSNPTTLPNSTLHRLHLADLILLGHPIREHGLRDAQVLRRGVDTDWWEGHRAHAGILDRHEFLLARIRSSGLLGGCGSRCARRSGGAVSEKVVEKSIMAMGLVGGVCGCGHG